MQPNNLFFFLKYQSRILTKFRNKYVKRLHFKIKPYAIKAACTVCEEVL